jgi:hypothetical protein
MKFPIFLVCIVLSVSMISCGAPKGGFVYINVEGDPEAQVTIHDQPPTLAKDLKNPYDLEPMMQRIKVEWSGINKTETQVVNVYYGETYNADFTAPQKLELQLSTEIPSTVKMGESTIGTHDSGKIKYYEGAFDFDVTLDGFDYTFKQNVTIAKDMQVRIVPGANDKSGSLCIISASNDAKFNVSCAQKPITNDGSIFIPNIAPGVVEIKELSNPNFTYYANIFPDQMTKLSFGREFDSKNNKHLISPSKNDAEISLLLDWHGRGASISSLGTGNLTMTYEEIQTSTPIMPFDEAFDNAIKYLRAVSGDWLGFEFIPKEFPDETKISLDLKGSNTKMKMPVLLSQKTNSVMSLYGTIYYDATQDAIVSQSENWAINLSSYMPCDWDSTIGRTLCYYRMENDSNVSFKEVVWNSKNTNPYSNHTIAGFKSDKPSFGRTGGFFWKNGKVLGIVGTDKLTYVFETSQTESKKIYQSEKPCSSVVLHGDRFLACGQGLEKSSTFYVIDLQSGKTYNDIAYPNITQDGMIVTSFNTTGITAGAIYKIENGTLSPVWAGLLEH